VPNIITKVLDAYHEGRLFSALDSRVTPFIYGLKYVIHDPASKRIRIHCPDYIDPIKDDVEDEMVERIFESFKKMKEHQKKADSDLYRPSSLWQQHLDNSYSYLTESLENDDVSKFHFFLSNFGTWKEYLGIDVTNLVKNNSKSSVKRKYLTNVLFYGLLKTWGWVHGNRKPIASLTYPTHGNQAGAYIDNTFVGLGSFFNEIYGSKLSALLADIERPVVADLGAGYGRLGYFTLRDKQQFCFIDFDFPETLCLAAYYLMKSWPNKRALLYGEEEYSLASHDQYDLVFMPNYEINKIGPKSVDLFMNMHSLGEMTKETVTHYIDCISKSTTYLFHLNHDCYPNIYSDAGRGLLGHEYPIPMDEFKLLFSYPDLFNVDQGKINHSMDSFWYLYERKDS
jgi:hypothetical protein